MIYFKKISIFLWLFKVVPMSCLTSGNPYQCFDGPDLELNHLRETAKRIGKSIIGKLIREISPSPQNTHFGESDSTICPMVACQLIHIWGNIWGIWGIICNSCHYQFWQVIIDCIVGEGCQLVITYQEIGLLIHPPTWYTGPPAIRWMSRLILMPPVLPVGGWMSSVNCTVYSRMAGG